MSRLSRAIPTRISTTRQAASPLLRSCRSYTALATPVLLRPRALCYNLQPARPYSSSSSTNAPEPPEYLSEVELHVFSKLKAELEPVALKVQDISGGCGSMFGLDIVSPRFNGLSVIKQHQLVNKVLAEEIKTWHGVQLKTKAAE